MKKLIYFFACLIISISSKAQDTTTIVEPIPAEKEIDASKPTNLYTQVNVLPEYQNIKNGSDLYGSRFNIQYAANADNLFIVEVPFLHSTATNKTGLSDLRVRYFSAVKRNITPRLIALAPFLDITAPTGSVKNGLGTGSWSLSAGAVIGYIVTSRFAVFPGVGYVHLTKPNYFADSVSFKSNGVGLQLNGSFSFSKRTFMFINPTPSFINTNGTWKSFWSGDFSVNRIVVPNKLKLNVSFNPDITNEIYVYRAGATFYL
jgi:hypothetical protein